MTNHLVPGPPKTAQTQPFPWNTDEGCLPRHKEQWEAKDPLSYKTK